MRITLPESSRRRQHATGGTLLSTAFHIVAIGGAVVTTGLSAPSTAGRVDPDGRIDIVYVPQEEPHPLATRHRIERASMTQVSQATPAVEEIPTLNLDAVGIPPSTVTLGVPSGARLEPVDVFRDGSPCATVADCAGPGARGDAPLTAGAVERRVALRRGAEPRYPALLASAGVEGRVVLRFVVDTLGRVEPASIIVSSTDHPLFAQSARDALRGARFDPAEVGGHTVRQLVEQAFAFELRGRH